VVQLEARAGLLQEGELLWLDADTLIRKMTNNKKSLDDFQKFSGQGRERGAADCSVFFDELCRI